MKRIEVEHIIETIFYSLGKLLHQVDRGGKKKHIHSFRIEIKKLKALLAFINTFKKQEEYIKIPKRLKSIYATAGKIREFQILSEKIKETHQKYDALKKYKRTLQSKKKACTRKLHRQIQEINLKNTEKKLTGQLPDDSTSLNADKFFNGKNQLIHTLLSGKKPSEKKLHAARKNIKDILYVSGFLKQHNGSSGIEQISLQPAIKNQENIANQLGLLNDMRVAISLLKTKGSHKEEVKELQSIKKKWDEEKRSILKQIHGELKNLFTEPEIIS